MLPNWLDTKTGKFLQIHNVFTINLLTEGQSNGTLVL